MSETANPTGAHHIRVEMMERDLDPKRAVILLGDWLDALRLMEPADAVREWGAIYPEVADLRQDLRHGAIDLLQCAAERLAGVVAHIAGRSSEPRDLLSAVLGHLLSDPVQRQGSRGGGSLVAASAFAECADPTVLGPFFELCLHHAVVDRAQLGELLCGHGHDAAIGVLVGIASPLDDPAPTADAWLEREAAARLIGVSPKRLSNLVAKGDVPPSCYVGGPGTGRRRRYRAAALRRWGEARRERRAAPADGGRQAG